MASLVLAPASSSPSVNQQIQRIQWVQLIYSTQQPGLSGLFFYSGTVSLNRSKSMTPAKPTDRVTVVLLGAMGAALIACVVLIWTISKLDNTPAWWKALDQTQTSEQAAIELENKITSALTRLRLPEDSNWSVAINQSQLNAWLTHRLKDTLDTFNHTDSIDQLGDVRMMLSPQGMTIGAQLLHQQGSSIVWVLADLHIDDQNKFAVHIKKARIGTTPIPAKWVSQYITNNQLGNAAINLGDGREVQIKALRTANQRLELALKTQTIP